jgi:hypothetical protein
VWHGKLQRDLQKGLEGLEGAWSERSSEFVGGYSAAAAGTHASASRQLGQENK